MSASYEAEPRLLEGARSRWQKLAIFAVVLAALECVLLLLQPAECGYGTHQQLGLSGCPTRTLLGIPCPLCGATTALAWLGRGEVQAAFRAQPVVALVGLVGILGVPLRAAGLLVRSDQRQLPQPRSWRALCWFLLLALLAQWVWRLSRTIQVSYHSSGSGGSGSACVGARSGSTSASISR